MLNTNSVQALTFQSIVIDGLGAKVAFKPVAVCSDDECSFTVKLDGKDGLITHIVNKDAMFQNGFDEYNLGDFKKVIWIDNSACFHLSRFVLGDATDDKSKAECFSAANEIISMYHHKDCVEGLYLNASGVLCKKDVSGVELLIEYTAVPPTTDTTYGWVQKQPERANNYPIDSSKKVKSRTERIDVISNPPKMSVQEWLNSDMEDLMTDSDRVRAEKSRVMREKDLELKRKLRKIATEQKHLNKKRLESWKAQKAKDALHGQQLSLI